MADSGCIGRCKVWILDVYILETREVIIDMSIACALF